MIRRILLIDDDRNNADLLALIFEREGAKVCVKYSGKTALEALEDFDPDLAIIDIGMEEMDGCELAKYFRQHEKIKHMPLIALTGYGGPKDKSRIKNAGFDLHLIKPIDAKLISQILTYGVNSVETNPKDN